MWLLDTEDGTFQHVDRPREHRYAILSHVWDVTGEQSFQDLIALQVAAARTRSRLARRLTSLLHPSTPAGSARPTALTHASPKIQGCCALARRHGYRKVWIDSCCIDKTSSAELSEAINSMCEWYAAADVCFALLADVRAEHGPRGFRRSRWFARGWTLQELIAPRALLFVDAAWRPLGSKASLASVVQEVTGVEAAVLVHARAVETVSVARRMAWAARRQTTRVEDRAYALMGLFGVHMPAVYGEGAGAFVRLQEEIVRRVPDQSIFAWGPLLRDDTLLGAGVGVGGGGGGVPDDGRFWQSRSLFAWSPDAFVNAGGLEAVAPEALEASTGVPAVLPEYAMTSHGVRTRLPLVRVPHGDAGASAEEGKTEGKTGKTETVLALLGCEDEAGRVVALLLYPRPDAAGRFFVGHYVGRPQVPPNSYFRAVCLSRARVAELVASGGVVLADVCIASGAGPVVRAPKPSARPGAGAGEWRWPCVVVVPAWSLAGVERAGFAAAVGGDEGVVRVEGVAPRVALVLVARGETIRVHVGGCRCLGRFLCVSVTGAKSAGGRGTSSKTSKTAGAGNRGFLADAMSAVRRAAPTTATGKLAMEGPLARCPADHVAAWEKGAKTFVCGSRTVRLVVSSWMTPGEEMYSLEVTVGVLSEAEEEEELGGRVVYAGSRSRAFTEDSDVSVGTDSTRTIVA